MNIAPAAEQITPLAIGKKIPNGPLQAMNGSQTTLYDVIENKPAVIIFYRGVW